MGNGYWQLTHGTRVQIASAVDANPEILRQVQEVVIPIIRFTLENKVIGALRGVGRWFGFR